MTLALGLDVGGTTAKAALLDASDSVVREDRFTVPVTDVLDFVVATIGELRAMHDIGSIGLGLAGLVSHPGGDFVWGPHLAGAAVPYRSHLSAALGIDVAVDNDANLAALAEWSIGAGERSDPMVMVTLGTGIGAGFIIDGRIFRGTSFAGEAGHVEVVDGGEMCACGRTGCWETVVSGATFDRLAHELASDDPAGLVSRLAGSARPTGVHLAEAAAAGDQGATGAIEEAGRWLGRGLANLVLLFDPARIVIGGAAVAAGPPLLATAEAVVRERMSGAPYRRLPAVVPARFGSLSGAVGAALAGREVQNG
jgi:glucokinase